MPRKGNILPKAPIARLMKEAGAKRVSDDCLEEMSNSLQSYAEKICIQAIKIANNSRRKTVIDTDIKLAMK
jgi:DNA-binding protein